MKAFPEIIAFLLVVFGLPGYAADLALNEVSRVASAVPASSPGGVLHAGADGNVYFFSTHRRTIYRVEPKTGSTFLIDLSVVPEFSTAAVSLMEDLAVDSSGQVFVPAIWHVQPKVPSAGFFVMSPQGKYVKTLVLKDFVGIRHFALDSAGNFHILGIDPGFYLGKTSQCRMMHKFTADGTRVSDYSPCPAGFSFGQSGNTRPGPDFDRLKSEVDRGRVWISANAIGQSLPISRGLRAFDANGVLLTETAVAAPVPGAGLLARGVNSSSMAADALWTPFVLRNGEFLFEWRTPASSKSGPLARYVSLHDAAGKALASASALPSGFVPALVNRDGLMVFVTIVGGNVGLVTASPSVQ